MHWCTIRRHIHHRDSGGSIKDLRKFANDHITTYSIKGDFITGGHKPLHWGLTYVYDEETLLEKGRKHHSIGTHKDFFELLKDSEIYSLSLIDEWIEYLNSSKKDYSIKPPTFLKPYKIRVKSAYGSIFYLDFEE